MNNTEIIKKSLKKRYAKEKRFRLISLTAVLIGFMFLVILLTDIIGKATPAFFQTQVQLEIQVDADYLDLSTVPTADEMMDANFQGLVKKSLYRVFPDVTNRKDKRALGMLISSDAGYQIKALIEKDPSIINTTMSIWVLADDDMDTYLKSDKEFGRISDKQADWISHLEERELTRSKFNIWFFSNGDSREPELAGIKGALMGSLYTLLITLLIAFPLGLASAIFLEEFAPKNNRWVDLIEINMNNLAAVPSIVFGLLGVAVFINLFGMPRSVPLVGGIVLALMTLPTIIISSRAAIKAVPPSIREAALGLGASRVQVTFHHVVPAAMPGILTGTIIGLAQALGETAPLLMIGMVAFIVSIPEGVLDSATVLPVQIFLWSDSPERAFIAKTAAAILTLIVFLVLMNSFAVWLRKKFENKW